jgi:hypothetical protein
MNSIDTRRYDMLTRVCAYGASHADAFPACSLGGKMFARVMAAVAALNGHAVAQLLGAGAVHDGARVKAAAHATLRDALRAISRTARALALDTPGLGEKFRVPHTRGEQALLSAGREFAQNVRGCTAAFVAHGLPPAVRKDLDAAIHGFETAIREDAASRATQRAARAAFDGAMEHALTAIRRLDAIVANQWRADRTALAAWERARHIARPPRARNGEAEPASPSYVPAPTPPVTTV